MELSPKKDLIAHSLEMTTSEVIIKISVLELILCSMMYIAPVSDINHVFNKFQKILKCDILVSSPTHITKVEIL